MTDFRKLFYIACLFIASNSFGQQVIKMKKMPVFIGCDQVSNNEDLRNCLNSNLSLGIQREIDFFSNIADYLHISDTKSKVKFTISKEGKFSQVDVQGINPIFNSFVWSSFILINNKIEQNGLKIEPALDQNNQPMDLMLSLPIKFVAQINPEVYEQFPADERVLFTIDFEDEIIEIRINKNNNLRTVGNDGRREFYLGKYDNLFEMATVEPYATKINEAYQSSYTTITKGQIDGKEYLIRMKNFFSTNLEDELLIEVIREENNTWAEYYSYKSKEEFNQSKFAKLTYR